jgi:hypothetical protein
MDASSLLETSVVVNLRLANSEHNLFCVLLLETSRENAFVIKIISCYDFKVLLCYFAIDYKSHLVSLTDLLSISLGISYWFVSNSLSHGKPYSFPYTDEVSDDCPLTSLTSSRRQNKRVA